MKSTVENLSTTRVKLDVEVPFDELKDKFDAAYKRIGAQVRVPGFRPGKVPAKVLEARVGRGAVIQEVLNDALPGAYSDAVDEAGIKPIGQPQIEVNEIGDDSFKFTAEVDTRPEFTVPNLDEIVATVGDLEISEEELDVQVDGLRDRFSTLKSVDREVQTGDYVSLDLNATLDGQELEGGSASGLSYEVGTNQLVPGIDDQLVGMKAEESKTFTSKLMAGEHADKDAEVTVTVNSVKEKELPELDDDFASMASEFDTLDELRGDLRTKLERSKDLQRVGEARDAVLDAIVEKVSFDVPQGLVDTEIEARQHDAVHSFDHNEDRLNEWITEQGQTREEFDAEIVENANRSVRAQLVLDQIVDDEQIGLEDNELTSYIIQQASRFGMAPQQFADEIQKAGQLGALFADARRNKAVDLVLAKATVKDESGNTLDLEKIREDAMAAFAQTNNIPGLSDDDDLEDDELDAETDADDADDDAEDDADDAGSEDHENDDAKGDDK